MHQLEYSVRENEGRFEAMTPYRHVVWVGDTEQEAIGAMLYGVARLARDGHINIDNPHAPGTAGETPQHV